jgi:hypothetical protein
MLELDPHPTRYINNINIIHITCNTITLRHLVQQLHNKIYTITQKASYMFQPFLAIIREVPNKEIKFTIWMPKNIYHQMSSLFSGICPFVSVVVYIPIHGSRVYISEGLHNPGGACIRRPLPPYCSFFPLRNNLAHVKKFLYFLLFSGISGKSQTI